MALKDLASWATLAWTVAATCAGVGVAGIVAHFGLSEKIAVIETRVQAAEKIARDVAEQGEQNHKVLRDAQSKQWGALHSVERDVSDIKIGIEKMRGEQSVRQAVVETKLDAVLKAIEKR